MNSSRICAGLLIAGAFGAVGLNTANLAADIHATLREPLALTQTTSAAADPFHLEVVQMFEPGLTTAVSSGSAL